MKHIFNRDVLLGFLIGVAATMVWAALPLMRTVALKDYQDLIAGILALLGAAAALVFVNRQFDRRRRLRTNEGLGNNTRRG